MTLIFKSGGSQDIEDYILKCSNVPMDCARNRDGTHIIGEFRMIVSETCPANLRTEDVEIEVYPQNSTYPQFIGDIIKSEFNTDKRTFELLIRSKLRLLTQKLISHLELDIALNTGIDPDEYNTSDEHGYSHVKLIFLVNEMFSLAGLGNYISGGDVFSASFSGKTIATFNFDGGDRTITFNHLRIDDDMLWCVNQSFATSSSVISGQEFNTNRISFWDFISNFLQMFGCSIFLSRSGTAKKYTIDTLSEPLQSLIVGGDDVIYNRKIGRINARDGGWTADHLLSFDRNKYRTSNKDSLGSHTTGAGKNGVRIYSNLLYLYHRYWDPNFEVIWGNNDDGNAYANNRCWAVSSMAKRESNDVAGNWDTIERRSLLVNINTNFSKNSIVVKSQTVETLFESISSIEGI